MKKIKKIPPRFKKGEQVNVYILDSALKRTIKEEPTWNGFTWMYSFEEEDAFRCGELYLLKIKNEENA